MGRDEEGRRCAGLFDRGEKALRLELLHQDDVGAEDEGAIAVGVRSRVVERGGDEEGLHHRSARRGGQGRGRPFARPRPEHALRPTRRSRGVEHVLAGERIFVGVAREGLHLGPRAEARDLATDRETPLGRDPLGRSGDEVGVPGVHDEGVRLAVPDDIVDVVGQPTAREGRVTAARPGRAAIGEERLRRVRGQTGDGASGRDAGVVERAAEAGGPGERFGVPDGVEGCGHRTKIRAAGPRRRSSAARASGLPCQAGAGRVSRAFRARNPFGSRAAAGFASVARRVLTTSCSHEEDRRREARGPSPAGFCTRGRSPGPDRAPPRGGTRPARGLATPRQSGRFGCPGPGESLINGRDRSPRSADRAPLAPARELRCSVGRPGDADPLRAPAGCRSGAGDGLSRRGRATGRAVRLCSGDQPVDRGRRAPTLRPEGVAKTRVGTGSAGRPEDVDAIRREPGRTEHLSRTKPQPSRAPHPNRMTCT